MRIECPVWQVSHFGRTIREGKRKNGITSAVSHFIAVQQCNHLKSLHHFCQCSLNSLASTALQTASTARCGKTRLGTDIPAITVFVSSANRIACELSTSSTTRCITPAGSQSTLCKPEPRTSSPPCKEFGPLQIRRPEAARKTHRSSLIKAANPPLAAARCISSLAMDDFPAPELPEIRMPRSSTRTAVACTLSVGSSSISLRPE